MKKLSKIFAVIIAAALSALTLTGCGGSSPGTTTDTSPVAGLSGVTDNVSSAQKAQGKADATNVTYAYKSMYAEVVAGTFNSSSPNAFAGLPPANASAAAKKQAALELTVADALKYAGLTELSSRLEGLVADTSSATVYSLLDDSRPATASTPVTPDTTMKDLGYK